MFRDPAYFAKNLSMLLNNCCCIRDLRVYVESLNGTVHHYRDKMAWNVTPNGQYGLVEIKLGSDKASLKVETLNKLSAQIGTSFMHLR